MPEFLELDRRFGPLQDPAYLRETEVSGALSQVFLLDDRSADYLRSLLDLAIRFTLFRELSLNLCLLWAVDADGDIWMSLEEVCPLSDAQRRFPRMRDMLLTGLVQAIGHPALVQLRHARIAGELTFDEMNGELFWIITNKSGRYGFGPQRQSDHLTNVAQVFAELGVDVQTYYLQG